jgi:hypothetical protein
MSGKFFFKCPFFRKVPLGAWAPQLFEASYAPEPNALPTELRGQDGSSMRYFGTESRSFDISII